MQVEFPSGRLGTLTGVSGKGVSATRWSDTIVTSHGGSGYVHPQHGGYVSGPTVESTIVNRHEFWLETSDKLQHRFTVDIPVAPGHQICLLWGDIDKTSELLYWRNYTSARHGTLDPRSNQFLLSLESIKKARKSFFVTVLVCFCAGYALGSSSHQPDQSLAIGLAIWIGIPVGLIIGWTFRFAHRKVAMDRNKPVLMDMCEGISNQLEYKPSAA